MPDKLPDKLTINKVVYRHDAVNEKAYALLAEALGMAWGEGYYDPVNKEAGVVCRKIADKLDQANKILKFRE